MIFKMKWLNIVIFSSILVFGNAQSSIQQPDLNKIKNEYKKEIESEIFRAKCLRYAAIGATTFGVCKLLFGSKKAEPIIKISAREFDEQKINVLNKLISDYEKGNLVFLDKQSKDLIEFIKNKATQLYGGVTFTIGSLVSSLPLILAQYYVIPGLEWLLYKHDLKWVIQKYSIVQMLSNLKLNAVILDPQSSILNFDNNIIFTNNARGNVDVSMQFSGPYFDELMKLKTHAKATLLNRSITGNDKMITEIEELSNKFVVGVSRVVAYLYYQEEQLILQNSDESWAKSKEINKCAANLIKITNKYCIDLNKALQEYESNEPANKKILSIIFEFNNLFNQIISDAYEV